MRKKNDKVSKCESPSEDQDLLCKNSFFLLICLPKQISQMWFKWCFLLTFWLVFGLGVSALTLAGRVALPGHVVLAEDELFIGRSPGEERSSTRIHWESAQLRGKVNAQVQSRGGQSGALSAWDWVAWAAKAAYSTVAQSASGRRNLYHKQH